LNPTTVSDDDQTTFGKIVGYRIYRTKAKGFSDDSEDNFPVIDYNTTSQIGTIKDSASILKKDFYFNTSDGTSDANCTASGCVFPGSTGQERRFYYYRLALIREHSSHTNGKKLFALQKNTQFITNINTIPQLKVLLPPTGYTYSHSNKLMILNTLSTSLLTYDKAVEFCSNSIVSLYDDDKSSSLARGLLTEQVYNVINPTSLTQPIWLFSSINYKFTDVGCIFPVNSIFEPTDTCLRLNTTATTGKKLINLYYNSREYISPAYVEQASSNVGYAMCFVDLSSRMP
jgi:hypothetical protein